MEGWVAFPISIAVMELCLRLHGRDPVFDLNHERKDSDLFVFATIDRPVDGRIDKEARALRFSDHVVQEISTTHL